MGSDNFYGAVGVELMSQASAYYMHCNRFLDLVLEKPQASILLEMDLTICSGSYYYYYTTIVYTIDAHLQSFFVPLLEMLRSTEVRKI